MTHAFNTIRDISIRGRLPIVFWDEFDCALSGRPLGWLSAFLSPMQDGTFSERGHLRPIGRCVFVFGGGIYATRADFERMERAGEHLTDTDRAKLRFETKSPDFLSRLRGYIDMPGLSAPSYSEGDLTERPYIESLDEAEYRASCMTRRALLLRAFCEKYKNLFSNQYGYENYLSIGDHLPRAFLLVKKYEHQARSLEAIVNMSVLPGAYEYNRSTIPSRQQLELHIEDGCDLSQAMIFDVWLDEFFAKSKIDRSMPHYRLGKFFRVLIEDFEWGVDSTKYQEHVDFGSTELTPFQGHLTKRISELYGQKWHKQAALMKDAIPDFLEKFKEHINGEGNSLTIYRKRSGPRAGRRLGLKSQNTLRRLKQ